MFPLRDTIPNSRFPLVTVAVALCAVVVSLSEGLPLLALVVGWFTLIYGRTLEEYLGGFRLISLLALTLLLVGFYLDCLGHWVVPLLLLQIPSLLIGAHLSMWLGAKILTCFTLPLFTLVVELPSLLYLPLWLGLDLWLVTRLTDQVPLQLLLLPPAVVLLGVLLVRVAGYRRRQLTATFLLSD